jgi:hypothetical protein
MEVIELRSIKDDDLLYVIQKPVRGKTLGDVNISLRDEDGSRALVTIPRTFIPIDLTQQADVVALKKCRSLKKFLASGLIEIISEKDANKILSTDRAKIEVERVKATIFKGVDLTEIGDRTSLEVLSETESKAINPTIEDTLLREDITDIEKVNLLSALPALNVRECDYLIASTEEKSKLHKWAVEQKKVANSIFSEGTEKISDV